MERAQAWMAGISTPAIAGACVLGAGLPLIASLWTTGIADLGLYLLAIAAAIAGGAAAVLKRQLSQLPLAFATRGLTGRVNGRPVYRFRVRLGHGRPMRNARAEVTWVGADGTHVPLAPVLGDAALILGPWTVVVVDADRRCAGEGAFTVRVHAEEGGRTWALEHRFGTEHLVPGRFGPGLRQRAGRLEFDLATFDTVVAEEPA